MAAALVLTITGNIGKFGTGLPYLVRATTRPAPGRRPRGRGRAWRCTPGEDPFNLTLDANAHGKEIKTKSYYYGEDVGFWNHGDTALIVNTPKYGRKVFTGKTHMPTPASSAG